MGTNCGAVDAVVAAIRHDLGQRHRDGFPNSSFAPTAKPAIDGVPATIFGWHIAPWGSAAKPPEYAVDDRAILFWRSASATVLRLDRQQVLQHAPFSFGEIAPAQNCLQKTALNQPLVAGSITSVRRGALFARKALPMRKGERRIARIPASFQPKWLEPSLAQEVAGAAETT